MSMTNHPEPEQSRVERRQPVVTERIVRRQPVLYKITQFIWLMTGILEGLIALRVFLKLIAANPDNPFARFVYGFTDLFLWPFLNLTATPAAGGMVLEIPSLIAMIVYALGGWVVVSLIELILKRTDNARQGMG